MKCPICNIDLLMGERFGVQIDYCSQCRGVWLDHGKLDKIIEQDKRKNRYREDDKDDNEIDEERDEGRKRKKRGFFDRITDVFD